MAEDFGVSVLQRKIAEAKLAQEQKAQEHKPLTTGVPEGLEDLGDEKQYTREFQERINSLPAVDAIRILTVKEPKPTVARAVDGNKFRCPWKAHNDERPSAWFNTETKLWHCGTCGAGGDWIALGAAAHGYTTYDQKVSQLDNSVIKNLFGELKVAIGYTSYKTITGETKFVPPEEEPAEAEEESAEPQLATVTSIEPQSELDDEDADLNLHTPIDWRNLIPTTSYIHQYMTAASKDDCPEEYHFWSALMSLGFAAGKQVYLFDNPPVYGNLFLCLLGRSSVGKSRSQNFFRKVLAQALPFDESNSSLSDGVRWVGTAGSGESMLDTFNEEIIEPSTKRVLGHNKIRGFVEFNELSALTSRAGRIGSTIIPQLMELYDCAPLIVHRSRGHGAIRVRDAFAQMLTTTQVTALRGLLKSKDVDNGFLNRWMFVLGTPKPQYSVNRHKPDTSAVSIKLKQIEEDFGDEEIEIDWTADSEKAWEYFFRTTVEPAKIQAAKQDATLGRIDLLLKKLILLFTLNYEQREVPVEAVDAAQYLWPYLLECYGLTSDSISTSDESDLHDRILYSVERLDKKHKKEGRRPPTVPQLLDAIGRRKYNDPHKIQKMLETMARLGELTEHVPLKAAGPGNPGGKRYSFPEA